MQPFGGLRRNFHILLYDEKFCAMVRGGGKSIGALLSTREVLSEHLRAKVVQSLDSNASIAVINEQIVEALLTASASNDDILALLQDPTLLEEKISSVLAAGRSQATLDKDDLGETLFAKVASIDSELCAQITGMLLELDVPVIEELISDPNKLTTVALQAKAEYIKFTKGSQQVKEQLGETIFCIASQVYPDKAAKITGMLLELDAAELHKLLENPLELENKMKVACDALEG